MAKKAWKQHQTAKSRGARIARISARIAWRRALISSRSSARIGIAHGAHARSSRSGAKTCIIALRASRRAGAAWTARSCKKWRKRRKKRRRRRRRKRRRKRRKPKKKAWKWRNNEEEMKLMNINGVINNQCNQWNEEMVMKISICRA